MTTQMDSLLKNQTWESIPQPQGKNVVKCRWLYRTKSTSKDVIEHHKACLVTKGLSRQEGIDYTETFASVAKINYVPLILSLVTHFGWKIHQMYVKIAFPHGDLSKEIYMEHSPYFVTDSNLVCQLKKSMYGFNQAPRAWYEKINRFFVNLGFKRCEYDHNLYVSRLQGDTLIVVVYVDDLVITGNNLDLI